MKMNKEILDLFGKMMMENVRDESIDMAELIISGKMKDKRMMSVINELQDVSAEQKEAYIKIAIRAVDITLSHFMWFIEQEDKVDLIIRDDETYSIKLISDGLKGELFSEDGWISRFSGKRNMEG